MTTFIILAYFAALVALILALPVYLYKTIKHFLRVFMTIHTSKSSPKPDDTDWLNAPFDGVATEKKLRAWAKVHYKHTPTNLPSDAEFKKMAIAMDELVQKRDTLQESQAIAVTRQPRRDIDITTAGTSWLGGLPALGDNAWPLGRQGRPMHHVAQIDLRTLTGCKVPDDFPITGSLAFFLSTDDDWPYEGKVVYISSNDQPPTTAPDNLPRLFEGPNWGYHIKGYTPENAPRTFARWPVDILPLPLAADTMPDHPIHKQLTAGRKGKIGNNLSWYAYQKDFPGLTNIIWWDTAIRVVNSLINAKNHIENSIAGAKRHGKKQLEENLIAEQDSFRNFVDETVLWAHAHSPWDQMTAIDIGKLNDIVSRVTQRHSSGPTGFHIFRNDFVSNISDLRYAADETLCALAVEKPHFYELLPAQIKRDIDEKHLLPGPQSWHQMFGQPALVQEVAIDHYHDYLLLQLKSDHLMNWMWGDVGNVHFWIDPISLKNRDWDKVTVTMEGH
ncbi:hypothetical protein DS901_07080 [Loktanella sp. D2R18]|uniref:DUF1963 domain-containing protein n=1 Tax=Rhodobacterales TaxID=204455 RepID=UPI000DEA865B|nr:MULTISPECIES: DUF1963 domain-containing protein [Rhodobacterales]MDO6589532.1 DUF1963 domain-containing protein [Yoonia sp. 1_MG-2023]RBW44176.1 hypothetical protein DS901_07080 [Loktanella sp. D2R18]